MAQNEDEVAFLSCSGEGRPFWVQATKLGQGVKFGDSENCGGSPDPLGSRRLRGLKKLEEIAADSMARLAASKRGEGRLESVELCAS